MSVDKSQSTGLHPYNKKVLQLLHASLCCRCLHAAAEKNLLIMTKNDAILYTVTCQERLATLQAERHQQLASHRTGHS